MIMFCTKCGSKIDGNSKFCSYCGQPIENYQEIVADTVKPNLNKLGVKNVKKLLFIIPVLLMVIGGYYFFFSYSGPDDAFVKADVTNYFLQGDSSNDSLAANIKIQFAKGKKSYNNIAVVPIIADVQEKRKLIEDAFSPGPGHEPYIVYDEKSVKKHMQYIFVYRKDSNKGWIRKCAYPSDLENWKLEPYSGITEQHFLRQMQVSTHKLTGKQYNEKVNNLKIVNRKSDTVSKGIEEISFSCDIVDSKTKLPKTYQGVAIVKFNYLFPQMSSSQTWVITGFKN